MEQLRKIVSEKETEKVEEAKTFGNAIWGFNKKEVLDYIESVDANYKTSVSSYENKLNEQSVALSMVLREKEKLTEELENLKKKIEILSVDVDEQKSEIVAENNVLKARIEEYSDVESRNAILISEMNDLKQRCEYSESGKKTLIETIEEKDEIILEQCKKYSETEKALKMEIERIKTEYEGNAKMYELKIQTTKDNLNKALNILAHN